MISQVGMEVCLKLATNRVQPLNVSIVVTVDARKLGHWPLSEIGNGLVPAIILSPVF